MPSAVHDRPTVFLLHALGASRRSFDALAAAVADTYDVVAIDLPGHGDAGTAEGVTVEDTVALVVRRIGEYAPARWVLVGHSMGGKIATIVASHVLAGRVGLFGLAGVVLLAGSPPSPEPMGDERRAEMLGWAADGPIRRADARTFVDANVGAPLSPADDDQAVADVMRTVPEAWTAWLERGSREDWSAEVGTLDVPAVIVAGGSDGDLGPDAQRNRNGAVYPGAPVVVLPGAGHLLPYERTAEVADLLVRFWHERAGLGPAVPRDTARTIAGPRTSARTRSILAARALADDPAYVPRVLSPAQLATFRVLADVVVPQDGPAVDLAARVDAQLAVGAGDGFRGADMPTDAVAYRLALDALADLVTLDAAGREARIAAVADGTVDCGADGGGPDGGDGGPDGLTADQMTTWFEDVRVDLVRQWLAHPATMDRVGWDGYANGGDGRRRQGYQLLSAGEREGWEPAMEGIR